MGLRAFLLLAAFHSLAVAATVTDLPTEIPSSSSVILGSAPMVNGANEVHCYTPVTGGTHYLQFEVNESGSDNTLDSLGLQFFTDIVTDGVFAGEGSAEDLDFVPVSGNGDPDFGPTTLVNTKAQSVHEWTLTGLVANTTYCVLITHFDEGAAPNGPERIQFSSGSAAIPEPSSFLLVAMLGVCAQAIRRYATSVSEARHASQSR